MKIQYAEAAKAIQNWITSQKLRHGERLPSARLLAEQIGFSQEATERACNVLIARGLLSRTGYKLAVGRDSSSQSPIKGTVYVVSYSPHILKMARRILTERGVKFKEIEISTRLRENPISALRKILAEKPDGIILWLFTWIDGLEPLLKSEKTPIVICADGAPLHVNLNLCGTDLSRATEKALLHLRDLGHRQIAHLTQSKVWAKEREIAECYQKICLQLDLKQSASNIWRAEFHDAEAYRNTLLKQLNLHPEVTALFIIESNVIYEKTNWIPERLSVVGLYESPVMRKAQFTSIGIPDNDSQVLLWACTEIISLIQTSESGHPRPLPRRTFFVPNLTVRASSRALAQKTQTTIMPSGEDKPPRMSLWGTWRKTYPPLKESGNYWKQLDLSKLANHNMTKEHGWLGDEPLLYFPSGLHSIHGVPFEILEPIRNRDRVVITFKSPHSHSSRGEKLPTTAKLPIGKRVKALYFLHGCGWVKWQEPFAEYRMHFASGKSVNISLIPAGVSRPSVQKRSTPFNPNLQDWWPHNEPLNYPHAQYVTIFNPADPQEYERTLYTLEWINPHPEEEVSFIEIRVDPKAGPALAVIAVTALIISDSDVDVGSSSAC